MKPRAPAAEPPTGPALALVELSSIARGMVVADAMVKKAPVRLLQNHPVSPGKHLILVTGEVAEIGEALAAGLAAAGTTLVDSLLLPYAHAAVWTLAGGAAAPAPGGLLESLCVFETFTIAATLAAADAAAKAAQVTLLEMRLGQGIGGKAYFTLTGELDAVEAAAAAGRAAVQPALVAEVEIIARPHDDLRRQWFR